MSEPDFHEMADGRRIAYRFTAGDGPLLVFLPGYMSDMDGGKATALFAWAHARGQAMLLLDYSGCGRSDGDFADGSLSRWREEVLALADHVAPEAPMVLAGSSMGGWLMLLVALALPLERRAGLVGIAAAPDFTDWGYPEDLKAELRAARTVTEPNPYGPEPTPTYAKFWNDGQDQRLLDNPIAIECPVRLIQGQRDPDVPWEIALKLADALASEDVAVHLVKSGDHRLSRPEDIALLQRVVEALLDRHPAAD